MGKYNQANMYFETSIIRTCQLATTKWTAAPEVGLRGQVLDLHSCVKTLHMTQCSGRRPHVLLSPTDCYLNCVMCTYIEKAHPLHPIQLCNPTKKPMVTQTMGLVVETARKWNDDAYLYILEFVHMICMRYRYAR